MALTDLSVAGTWEVLADDGLVSTPHVQDWMGNRWPVGSFPVLPAPGWRTPRLPQDGDGFRAGSLEWAAFAIAVHVARKDPRPAVLAEMGASQAPWCLSWIRAHRKLGLAADEQVRAVAFEAAAAAAFTTSFWAQQDLGDYSVEEVDEGLRFEGPGWSVDWLQRAVATGGGTMHFPEIDVSRDNGGQAVRTPSGTDYRGVVQSWRVVQAVDPVQAVLALDHVHLLHLDIQGSEEEVLRSGGFDHLFGRVSVLMLGTHSRAAEGLAFEHLPRAGMVLVAEEPCRYEVVAGTERLVQDGEQLWVSVGALRLMAEDGLLAEPALLQLAEERSAALSAPQVLVDPAAPPARPTGATRVLAKASRLRESIATRR